MTTYMMYSRDSQGLITRLYESEVEDTSPYTKEECLKGWPESRVFWQTMEDGSAVGIVPKTE